MSDASPDLALPFVDLRQQHAADRLGLWVFLVTEILLFGGFFAAYTEGRTLQPQVFAEASRHLDLMLGAIEAGLLLLGSYAVTVALQAIREDRRQAAMGLLALTGILGLAFLGLHVSEYVDEAREHLVPGPGFGEADRRQQLFFYLYYTMTGFHALHVAVGVALMAWLVQALGRGRFSAHHHPAIELTALFWHLIDIVWIFLFPLFYLVNRQ